MLRKIIPRGESACGQPSSPPSKSTSALAVVEAVRKMHKDPRIEKYGDILKALAALDDARMSTSPDRKLGKRDGLHWTITWAASPGRANE
jgi:hypothetical protein